MRFERVFLSTCSDRHQPLIYHSFVTMVKNGQPYNSAAVKKVHGFQVLDDRVAFLQTLIAQYEFI